MAKIQQPEPETKQQRPFFGCPKCHCKHLRVVYTRPVGKKLHRRRECRNCGHRISTYEEMAT